MTGSYTDLALALIQCGACETARDTSEEVRRACKPLSRSDRCVNSHPERRDAVEVSAPSQRKGAFAAAAPDPVSGVGSRGGVDTNALTSAAFVPESTMRFTHPRRTNPKRVATAIVSR